MFLTKLYFSTKYSCPSSLVAWTITLHEAYLKELAFFEKTYYRSSHSEVFLRKGVLKISSKFTGEHPCRSAISIKLQSNFIEIVFRHGCSPVNLLHISEHLFLGIPLGGCFFY